ncbi:MAG: short-chain dehydrogenase/reductase, partial [Mycobacterium sp.]
STSSGRTVKMLQPTTVSVGVLGVHDKMSGDDDIEQAEQLQARTKELLAGRPAPGATYMYDPALLQILEKPPLRIFFGERPLQLAKADYESRLAIWEEWQPVSIEAQG